MNSALISFDEATNFINKYYSGVITLEQINSGKHSVSFSYQFEEKDFIVRFNETDFGFEKDKYAFEHFATSIPIPKIFDIGKHDESHYCISKKISGHSIRDGYNQEKFTSFEQQFKMIEKIASQPAQKTSSGFGEWSPETLGAEFLTLSGSLKVIYDSDTYFNWEELEKTEGFEKDFMTYLVEQVKKLLPFSEGIRELRHGDFGNDNVLINEGKISGVIDWHKSAYEDHLFDVARVILYCPNRQASSKAALDFYQNTTLPNWKERILLGVYVTMLTNYGHTAKARMIDSLKSSPTRIKEIENSFF